MRQGFIKVAALTPKVKVADTTYNREQICMLIDEAQEKGAKILVFPELCITGYTCGDLFYQELLLREAKKRAAGDRKIYRAQRLSGVCGTSTGASGKIV